MKSILTLKKNRLSTLFACLLACAFILPQASAQDVSLDLAFVTHLDINVPEQDVFIEREPGSGEVYRVTKGDHNMNAPLYAASTYIPHDPFNPEAVGPFEKGAQLNMTLGDWLKHSGQGTYTCQDGTGTLDLTFTGLVPEGVYTLISESRPGRIAMYEILERHFPSSISEEKSRMDLYRLLRKILARRLIS